MKFISALNAVATNVWSIVIILIGAVCLTFHEREGALMLIGGGLAILRGPAKNGNGNGQGTTSPSS